MKKILYIFISFFCTQVYCQKERSTQLGQVTLEELKMTFYKKDSSASAVVLYDEGNRYYSDYKKRLFTTDFYSRIKILNNNGLKHGSQKFRLYYKNTLNYIEAVTSNIKGSDKIEKTVLNNEDLIIDDKNEYYSEYIINLPNVKVGSIIELRFSVTSENLGISNWTFQENIPTIKSVFKTLTPKTMNHIVNLIGIQGLTHQEKIKKTKCILEKKRSPDCEFSAYIMESIPAFKKEVLMPHPSVLISKLKFRLSYYLEKGFYPFKMMTKWSQFDKSIKRYYFDQEMTKERYFKKIIPDSLLNNGTKLQITKNIFHFIQDHYTWNGKEGGDTRINIRKNYKNKEASVDLIATTLYNSLKGAGIECYYVAVSTNSKGPVDRLLPVISDFNYTVVKAVVDDKTYFLDATDKSIGFGYVQPFASVKDGRVLDYTIVDYDWDQGVGVPKGSYWEYMKPLESDSRVITTELNLSEEKGLYGRMNIKRSGYNALKFRRNINKIGENKKIENLEDHLNDYEIDSYKIKNLKNRDLSTIEKISFKEVSEGLIENTIKNKIRFMPILIEPFQVNPFLSEKRIHPIDFIYSRNLKYRFTFNIPDTYKVISMPKNVRIKLSNNAGSYLYRIENKNGKVKIYVNLKITKPYFKVNEYEDIKKFHNKIVAVEKSYIELEKIDN
tara:strand:+ start:491 stop:2494 length:2004 start_codon:yes stop_codon:yes gene_type:complete